MARNPVSAESSPEGTAPPGGAVGAAPRESAGVARRDFLRLAGAGAAAGLLLPSLAGRPARAGRGGAGPTHENRAAQAFRTRVRAAKIARRRPHVAHVANGDESDHPGFVGNYHKGLPHGALGQVDPAAYLALLDCLRSRDPARFEELPLGLGEVKLTSPQAGLAFDLEGPDSHHVTLPPAPRLDSAECAGEMVEVYWMALARDVHFEDYASDPITLAAAADLSALSDFRGPKAGGAVTPETLFRGYTAGHAAGPWISQFLYLDVPFGPQRIVQRNQTTLPGSDFMTSFDEWLAVQNGADRFGLDALDPVPRHLRNLRDLARFVQIDALYQAYLNACLILLGIGAPFDAGMPLRGSATQVGFAEWGGPHILSLVSEVATRALKAVWYQKWFVHRRLRPEAYAGLVHNHMTAAASHPLHADVLGAAALGEVFERHATYLLPMAFPEGCPTHPAYGAGHATVAGACTTILKAWFDESFVLPDPVVASADGTALVPWTGADLTLGGELEKVASNIALGRNGAGVHWRTDYTESLRLGEEIALDILEEQKATYNEAPALTLTTFDGETVTI